MQGTLEYHLKSLLLAYKNIMPSPNVICIYRLLPTTFVVIMISMTIYELLLYYNLIFTITITLTSTTTSNSTCTSTSTMTITIDITITTAIIFD